MMTMRRMTMVLAILALGCSDPTVSPTMAPSAGVSRVVVPSTIDATGATDVTDTLNAWLASVPDTSEIRFPLGAIYRVEGIVRLVNRQKLTINGQGGSIIANTTGSGVTPPPGLEHLWPRRRSHLSIIGGRGHVIKNLIIRGANPYAGLSDSAYNVAYEAQHGIELLGAVNVRFDNVQVTDVWGDFVYLGAENGITQKWADSIVIDTSHFDRNGRQGIAMVAARNVTVKRSYVGNVRRTSIDIEPNATWGGAQHVYFQNNRFGPTRLNFFSSIGAAGLIDHVTIEGSQLTGHALKISVQPPAGSRRSRITILNNVSTQTFGAPVALMRFTRIDGLTVKNNVQPLQAGRNMTGVQALESCDVLISGNVFANAAQESYIGPWTCP